MYIYIYTNIYTNIYIYICVYIYVYIYVFFWHNLGKMNIFVMGSEMDLKDD